MPGVSELEIIGRAILRPSIGHDPPPAEDEGTNGTSRQLYFTLCEVAALCDYSVDEVKREIRAGRLKVSPWGCGRYRVHRGDLNEWMRR